MTYYRKITGEKCYLSPCSMSDAGKLSKWDNDLETAICISADMSRPMSYEKRSEMIRKALSEQEQLFSIVACKGDKIIGLCGLFGLDHVHRSTKFHMLIGDRSYRNNGYGCEAVMLLADHAFNLLNLNSIAIDVLGFNKSAVRCYEKAGFKVAGRLRQAKIVGGTKADIILMDLLSEEFVSPYVKHIVTKLSASQIESGRTLQIKE
ncbi:MAG: GNAT family N-acetyltransferase [Desulfobacteraceae bacterium]|nr:GNAT family N-acetyltransferase [Desulfobacteraceae bacterium]